MADRISLVIRGHNHFSFPPVIFGFPVLQGKSTLKKPKDLSQSFIINNDKKNPRTSRLLVAIINFFDKT